MTQGVYISLGENANTGAGTPLESYGKVIIADLIGEGVIDGICDSNGEDIAPLKQYQNNEDIYKGVYLNDVAVKNTNSDVLNYTAVKTNFFFGKQFQKASSSNLSCLPFSSNDDFSYTNPAVAYSIDKRLYPLRQAAYTPASYKNYKHHSQAARGNGLSGNFEQVRSAYSQAVFEECFGVTHEIRDKGTKFLIVTISIDQLYRVDKKEGHTLPKEQVLGFEIGYHNNPNSRCFITHSVYGIASSPYLFDMYFDVSDWDKSLGPYLKIYNFSAKIPMTDSYNFRSVSVKSIFEVQGNKFEYPNSAYVVNEFDARSFGDVPSRSYDLRLLRVKVPYNYDSEARKYFGNWDGVFDSILRWTDNPAWILYDIISNDRYGIAKYTKDTTFLNKWTSYQMAKYCDELVSTFNASRYLPIKVCEIVDRNTICLTFSQEDQARIGRSLTNIFGNSTDYEIALMNLRFYDPVSEEYYYKCFRGYIVEVDDENNLIYLASNFGLQKMMSIFPDVYRYVNTVASPDSAGGTMSSSTIKNNFAASLTKRDYGSASVWSKVNGFLQGFSNYSNLTNISESDLKFFTEDEVNYYVPNSGKAACVFRSLGFQDLVEPRFSTNIYLQQQTQVIDLIDNLASIFRGMIYWNNLSINFASDKKQKSVYAFSNSNVKDGIFSYAGSSKDARYTVCKIVFSDKQENYRDRSLYVEDFRGIRDYGYIEREIIGFGITSAAQAKRIAKWFLLTNQIEKESVIFTTGQEGVLLNVGDIISISDNFKLNGQRSGRIFSYTTDSTFVLTLDNRYDFISANDKISVIIARSGVLDNRELSSDSIQTSYIYTFLVDEVEVITSDDDFRTNLTLNISSDEDKKAYGAIKKNTVWIFEEKYQSDLLYKKEYRIVSIKEKENAEFEIAALDYAYSKFDYLDFDASLDLNPTVADSSAFEKDENNYVLNDLFSSLAQKRYLNSDEGDTTVGDLIETLCPDLDEGLAFKTGSEDYDYIFPSEIGTQYDVVFQATQFFPSVLYAQCIAKNIFGNEVIGLVVEIVMNFKKVSFKWIKGDEKSSYLIAYPKEEYKDSTFDIRVYKIGENYEILQ